MKKRLDEILVERGLAATRSRARDVILRGLVTVEDAVVAKAGAAFGVDVRVAVSDAAGTEYVSRGALKLIAALDGFGFDAQGRVALDAGASTGGFTEVLVRRGAAKVFAVDVGHGQLHARLLGLPQVVALEGRDVRTLDASEFGAPVDAVVADLSFIALAKVLPHLMSLAAPGAWLVALIKPQFEAGRDAVGKGGVVRDEAARAASVATVRAVVEAAAGWSVAGVLPSPVTGGSGNVEYLMGARRDG